MNTIHRAGTSFMEVKKSRFHGWALPVDGEESVKAALADIRRRHPKARHVCYAYRLWRDGRIEEAAHDAGEPRHTAGAPILRALQQADLVNALGVVVRYFGGILLGKGGLIRAYGKAARAALDEAAIGPFEPLTHTRLTFPLEAAAAVERFARRHQIRILDRAYTAHSATFHLQLNADQAAALQDFLQRHPSTDALP